MTPRKRILCALYLMLAAGLLGPRIAAAANFDLSIFHNEREALAETSKWWAAEIDKQTSGRVQFKAHYSGALTSAAETLNAVRNGGIPAGLAPASFVSGLIPPVAYLEPLFWLTADVTVAGKALETLQPKLEDLFRQRGVEYLWLQPSYGLLVACRDKHLKQPADWKGLKIRAAGRWQGIQLTALGATPVAIDPGEQYLALQNKTVDCALSNGTLALSLKLHEVAPKITYLRGSVNASMYLMNAKSWQQLSPADQQTVRNVSREAMRRALPYLVGEHEKAIATMKQAGADIYAPPEDDLKATRGTMAVVFDKIGEGAGDAGKPIAAELRSSW